MRKQKDILHRFNPPIFEEQILNGTVEREIIGGYRRAGTSSFTIAHIADPHIDMAMHPERLSSLRELLVRAIRNGVSHIVISGDIASVPEVSSWIAVRTLLQGLGIYHKARVSIVIGNHDVFGGPNSTFETFRFQRKCQRTNVEKNIRQFESVFAELFRGTLHPSDSPFPYVKVVGSHVFVGINSVAPFSLRHNPCASNGEVPARDIEWIDRQLTRLSSYNKVIIMHHHLLNHKAQFLKKRRLLHKLLYWLEDKTLRLRDNTELIALFRKHAVEAVLH